MKPHRRKRLAIILFIASGLAVAVSLTLFALRQNINFFYTPSQVAMGEAPAGQNIRVGGMVKAGSVQKRDNSMAVSFLATDYANDLSVHYEGILPDLFREGQGITVEGRVGADGVFVASRVLAKHDENYMSPEVKAALDAAHQNTPGYPESAAGLPDDS